jgi:hypothetical protein
MDADGVTARLAACLAAADMALGVDAAPSVPLEVGRERLAPGRAPRPTADPR